MPHTITCLSSLSWDPVFHHVLVKSKREETVDGSGGHTTEMLRLMCQMDLDFYTPRTYVVADTDKHSAAKSASFEEEHHRQASLLIPLSPRCLDDRRE